MELARFLHQCFSNLLLILGLNVTVCKKKICFVIKCRMETIYQLRGMWFPKATEKRDLF